jgi:Flp pilus assembly protein TadG
MLISKKIRDQKGVALVEFAIALPLLLLLLFGFIEFGVMLYNKQVITNASREGARAAINPVPLLTQGQVETIVTEYCNKLIYFGTLNPITVTPSLDPNGGFEDRDFEDDVIIQVSWQYDFLVPSILKLGASIPINAKTTMKMM